MRLTALPPRWGLAIFLDRRPGVRPFRPSPLAIIGRPLGAANRQRLPDFRCAAGTEISLIACTGSIMRQSVHRAPDALAEGVGGTPSPHSDEPHGRITRGGL